MRKASLMDFVTHWEILPIEQAYFGLFADDTADDDTAADDTAADTDTDTDTDTDNISLMGEGEQ